MSTKYENYITGDDVGASARSPTNWNGQTFTPLVSHRLTSVKLLLYKEGSPGAFNVVVKATDVDGKPTGAVLCSGTTSGNSLPDYPNTEWRQITLGSGSDAIVGTKYAIIFNTPAADASNFVASRRDTTSPTYTGGAEVDSNDGGVTWAVVTTVDLMFEEWGDSLIVVQTDAATNITNNSAQLNGTLVEDAADTPVQCSFEWGLTTAYGNTTLPETVAESASFSKVIGANLTPGTTYHFRAKAVGNSGNTVYGADRTFAAATPAESLVRVTGLVHRWSAGPNPVYQLEILRGGLFSQYFSPISPTKTPEPTVPIREAREAEAYKPTLRDYAKWLGAHTAKEIKAIFGEPPAFRDWSKWYLEQLSMGK